MSNSIVAVYLVTVAVLSLISFLLYGWDKYRARQGGRRVPEQTFHLLALFGGWPGAWVGQQRFRHKTQKVPFRIAFWFTVFVHCGCVCCWVLMSLNPPVGVARPSAGQPQHDANWQITVTPARAAP